MTRLEDLTPNAAIRGIIPDQTVTVVNTQWFGSEALELTRPEISVSIGQQGTSGNPEIPLGTAGTANWGPYRDSFGHCPTMCPTISPNDVVLVWVEFTFDQ